MHDKDLIRKKLTILDIAKLANVGKSTVSRVITGDPKVKQATREKVEKIINNHGFVPSKSAQSMRGGQQKIIGIIISRLDSPSEHRAVSSILNVFYADGYDVVLMESQFDAKKTNEHLQVLARRNVDGVILFGFSGCDLKSLRGWKNRIVVIAIKVEGISSVYYDDKAVIELALSYLKKRNIIDISYIGVELEDLNTGLSRLHAYKNWCKDHQLLACYQLGKLGYESAYFLVDKVLKDSTQAIVCATDSIAVAVIKRLQELGRDDILVTGVGENELLSFLFPSLFSVDPGYAKAGKKAANRLLLQLKGETNHAHIIQQPQCNKAFFK